jgi:large-conductance mechanosensitive channel
MVDLILVPGLFILSYLIVILLYPSRSGISSWREAIQRVGAVFAGVVALLLCVASGALISWLVRDHLSRPVRNGIDSLAINADIHLPYVEYQTIHLRGNIISLVCFIIGIAICIRQIKKVPGTRKVARLTREQQMTPYQRMLREKRELEKARAPRKAAEAPVSVPVPSTISVRSTTSAPSTTSVRSTTPARSTPSAQPTQGKGRKAPVTKPGPLRLDGAKPGSVRPDDKKLPALCRTHPLLTLEPEAVRYMPMG